MKDLLSYNFPEDLRSMSTEDLDTLAYQIRSFLIQTVSKKGGHLASNLGVCELTIGLHKVFNSPEDKFIFDVGHQCYVHKILTGRAKYFDSLRELNGLSGFPKSKESAHDQYDTGHSSTSISAAFGMAKARDLNNENYNVIAVIGDGSMTGGQAYEALNNIGSSKTRVIVILNDNGISINKNVGGLSKHLIKLRTSHGYLNSKSFIKNKLSSIPKIGKPIAKGLSRFKNKIKYILIRQQGGVLFEELGFTYFGPVDGNNISEVIEVLEKAKELNEPILIHMITKKGKGYSFAEENPAKFHGIGPFNSFNGNEISKSDKPSCSELMGKYVLEEADKDKKIVSITAAMGDSVGLYPFSQKYPDRFFDVGIAEQHAVSFAAGLAKGGMKPYCAIYSTFMQRAYDQMLMDVCMQNLPVVFGLDRAGVVGKDGETHNGCFDLSYMLPMPNLTIFAPFDEESLKDCVKKAFAYNSPVAIRYPRGTFEDKIDFVNNYRSKICILPVGKMYYEALRLSNVLLNNGISTCVEFCVQVKPFKADSLESFDYVITLEDNVIIGGFGEMVKSALVNSKTKVLSFGWPDKFIEHGSYDELAKKYMLDADNMAFRVMEFLKED